MASQSHTTTDDAKHTFPDERHDYLDSYGFCQCGWNRNGIDYILLDCHVEWGKWELIDVPYCVDCNGII